MKLFFSYVKPSRGKVLIKILFFFILSVNSQTSLDSLTINQIKELATLNNKEEASKLLLNSLNELNFLSVDKNMLAEEFEKYRTYFNKLTTNPEIRKSYYDQLIYLRENATVLDSLGLVTSYFYAANDAHQLRKHKLESLNYIEKGITYWEKFYTKPTDLYAQMLTQKGASLQNNLLTYEAFSANENTLKVYETIDKPDKSILYSLSIQLAKNYSKFGFYKKANYHLTKADNILSSEAERFKEAEKKLELINGYQLYLLSTYSRYYRDIHDEKKLLENIKRANELKKDKKLISWAQYYYAEIYNYTGFYYLDIKKDYTKAFEMFKKARENIDDNYNPVYLSYYEMNMARALIELNEQNRALITLNKIEKKPLPSSLKGIVYMSKAFASLKNNNQESLIKYINKGMSTFSKSKKKLNILSDSILINFKPTSELYDTNRYLKIANEIGKQKNKNDTQKILINNLYKVALIQFKNSYQKNVYSKFLEEMYNTIFDGVLKSNKERYGKLFLKNDDFIENLIVDKSSFLWHNFLANRSSNVLDIPDSLSVKEQNLRRRLILYEQNLKQNQKDSTLLFNIEEVKEKLEIVSNQLNKNYKNFNLFDRNKFSLKDFQSNLDNNEVVLNYFVLNSSLYLLKISKKDLDIKDLGDYSIIESKSSSFLSKLLNLKESPLKIKENGKFLYNKLLPINISEFEKITIVPDKILHYLPFEVLSNNANEYMIENYIIKNSISIPFLTFNEENDTNRVPKLFSPDYSFENKNVKSISLRDNNSNLLGAKEEAEAISDLINGDLFSGNDATKTNFIKNSKNSSILHLAMHALIDEEDPQLSNFVFSDATSDNKLYLSELYGLNMNASLAVLAACNTGVGEEKAGEGIISLNRAFTYAGVPTTVSSLWNLPDTSTKQIMISFYNNLKNNRSTSVALRNAKINYLENQNNVNKLHPFYWSGLVLHGKDLKVDFNDESYLLKITIILLLISLLVLFFKFKKKI